MADDLRNALNRKLVAYEKAGLTEQVEILKARLAEFDKPEPIEEEPEPVKRAPGRPRKEG